MNENNLWEKFAESGSVQDYLAYSAAKNETADCSNDYSRGNRP